MASIRERRGKKGTSYLVEVRVKGFPPQSASFKRLTDAKLWAVQTEAAIREGRYFKQPLARKKTLKELIDQYLEICLPCRGEDKETVKPHLLWWRKQIGAYMLIDITPTLLSEQKEQLRKVTYRNKLLSNATIIRYLASLSVCLSYGVEELGWLETNPVRQVRKPKLNNGQVRFLSEDELSRLLAACQINSYKPLYLIVLIAIATGARLSEITGLHWKEIDFVKQRAILNRTKNNEKRTIPLNAEIINHLKKLSQVRRIDTDLVFPNKKGTNPIDIRKPWNRAIALAEIEDFRFHDLRHTAASYLAMSGATLLEISSILGHKTMQMVKRYAHLTDVHAEKIVLTMNDKYLFTKVNS